MTRRVQFQKDNFYHVYNRGVDKRKIFLDTVDFKRFIQCIKEFNRIEPIGSLFRVNRLSVKNNVGCNVRCRTPHKERLVEIVAYNLIPNHYHFILKQISEGGISEFMKRINGGYTNYFNLKYKRSGALLQGKFKAVLIDSDDYLLWLSAYVNGNSQIHNLANAKEWRWSSYQEYLGNNKEKICNSSYILNEFKSVREYSGFVNSVIKESKKIKEDFKKYLIE